MYVCTYGSTRKKSQNQIRNMWDLSRFTWPWNIQQCYVYANTNTNTNTENVSPGMIKYFIIRYQRYLTIISISVRMFVCECVAFFSGFFECHCIECGETSGYIRKFFGSSMCLDNAVRVVQFDFWYLVYFRFSSSEGKNVCTYSILMVFRSSMYILCGNCWLDLEVIWGVWCVLARRFLWFNWFLKILNIHRAMTKISF